MSDVENRPGYDDRKELADIFQDNGGVVTGSLKDIYPALIAVAQFGWNRAVDD